MVQTVRIYFRVTIFLVVSSVFVGVLWHRPDLRIPPYVYILLLGLLTSCWCNILLIRGGYVGKSSLVIWVLVSVLGVPPLGFFGMLFVLWRSIKNIETTGKT